MTEQAHSAAEQVPEAEADLQPQEERSDVPSTDKATIDPADPRYRQLKAEADWVRKQVGTNNADGPTEGAD